MGAVRRLIKPEKTDAKDGCKGCISGRVIQHKERGQEGELAQLETGGV